ncbi:unnamed protein product [Leptidea sinapis]|uniref:Uncharacterized protein n=1 Tax=Leptidea sinapis TaxID=189913 RepID=A0A5E4Q3F9_9NEOP|nr:unnamed protein product [Leptidea sinapis]
MTPLKDNQDVASFLVTKHTTWKGKYKRVFSIGTHGITTYNPDCLEITNRWLYADIFGLVSPKNINTNQNYDFTLLMRKDKKMDSMKFSSEYKSYILTEAFKYRNVFAEKPKEIFRFQAYKHHWSGTRLPIVLEVGPCSLEQLDPSTHTLLATYPYCDIQGILPVRDVPGGFVLAVGGYSRLHMFSNAMDHQVIINKMLECGSLTLNISIKVLSTTITLDDYHYQRFGKYSGDQHQTSLSEFMVHKVNPARYIEPMRRTLCLSDTCLLERDPQTYSRLFAENKEKLITGALSALISAPAGTNLTPRELEAQFHALRRLCASKVGFAAFTALPGFREWIGTTVVSALRRESAACSHAALEAVCALLQPMHAEPDLRQEQLNKASMLSSQPFLESLLSMWSQHITSGSGALVVAAMLDFLTFALCVPYSETTDGKQFDQLLEMVASRGRVIFKLFEALALAEAALPRHLLTALYAPPRAVQHRHLARHLVALWLVDHPPAADLLRRIMDPRKELASRPVVLRRRRERLKSTANWAMFYYQFHRDHALPNLIWNHTIRVFTSDREVAGGVMTSWNHAELEVHYQCLQNEVKIGDYYLRILLEQRDNDDSPIRKSILVDLMTLAHLHTSRATVPAQTNVIEGPASTGEGDKEWYYNVEQGDKVVRKGPVSFQQLKELYKSGEINNKTKCWANSMEGWRAVPGIPQLRWSVAAKGPAALTETELAATVLELLITCSRYYPSRDEEDAVIRPLPRVKRLLSEPSCLAHVVQLLLTFDPILVEKDNPEISKLYLTGVFYFMLLYTGSNVLPIARFLRLTHMKQAFRLDQRSILGQLLPDAMVCYLENHGAEKFAQIFLGEWDTPEAIWNSEMRVQIASNLVFDQLKSPQVVGLLKDVLEAWRREVEKKPASMTAEQAYMVLGLGGSDGGTGAYDEAAVLQEALSRCVSVLGGSKQGSTAAQVCTHCARSFAVAATFPSCRDVAASLDQLCTDLVPLLKRPRLGEVAVAGAEAVAGLSAAGKCRAALARAGALHALIPLLLEYDYTLTESGDTANRLGVQCLRALAAMYGPHEEASPLDDEIARTLQALLTPHVCDQLHTDNPHELLKTLTSNWRTPYLVWDNSTRAELRELLADYRPDEHEPLVRPFQYSAHQKLLTVGGVYLDIYNEQPDYPIEKPQQFVVDLLQYIESEVREDMTDERANNITLGLNALANCIVKNPGVESQCIGHFGCIFGLVSARARGSVCAGALRVVSVCARSRDCVDDVARSGLLPHVLPLLAPAHYAKQIRDPSIQFKDREANEGGGEEWWAPPGEIVVGGVYLKLYLQNPHWSLRSPKKFLQELVSETLSCLNKDSSEACVVALMQTDVMAGLKSAVKSCDAVLPSACEALSTIFNSTTELVGELLSFLERGVAADTAARLVHALKGMARSVTHGERVRAVLAASGTWERRAALSWVSHSPARYYPGAAPAHRLTLATNQRSLFTCNV